MSLLDCIAYHKKMIRMHTINGNSRQVTKHMIELVRLSQNALTNGVK